MCIKAVGPQVPVISDGYWMDNWRRFIFSWKHAANDQDIVTEYFAWFRRDGFVLLNLLLFKVVEKTTKQGRCPIL